MKKEKWTPHIIAVTAFVVLSVSVSCASAMQFDKSATLQESMTGINTEMEFIGFKATVDTLRDDYDMWQNFKKDTVIARFGTVLQDKGIAYDQSFAYFGIYSLQEIAMYNSKQRYVTFVEAEKNSFTYSSNIKSKRVMGGIGGGLFGAGLVVILTNGATQGASLVPGAVVSLGSLGLLIPALIPAKTTIRFNGAYSIYVYDTEKKEIIYRDTINVGPLVDIYSGSYDDSDTNKTQVLNYYSTLVFNEILKKYNEIYLFLQTRK